MVNKFCGIYLETKHSPGYSMKTYLWFSVDVVSGTVDITYDPEINTVQKQTYHIHIYINTHTNIYLTVKSSLQIIKNEEHFLKSRTSTFQSECSFLVGCYIVS